MRRSRRGFLPLAVSVAAALATSAMALSGGPTSADTAAAGLATEAAGRARYAFNSRVEVEAAVGTVTERRRERGRVDFVEERAEGSVRVARDGDDQVERSEVRLVDGQRYERRLSPTGGAEGWVSDDQGPLDRPLEAAQRLWSWQYEVVELPELLQAVVGDLQRLESTVVRDGPVERYALTVDLRPLAEAGVDVAALGGRSSGTVWVWLDGGGRARRIGTEAPAVRIRAVGGQPVVDVLDKVQLELWDYGVGVDVDAPVASPGAPGERPLS